MLGDGGQRVARRRTSGARPFSSLPTTSATAPVAERQVVEGLIRLAGEADRPHAELAQLVDAVGTPPTTAKDRCSIAPAAVLVTVAESRAERWPAARRPHAGAFGAAQQRPQVARVGDARRHQQERRLARRPGPAQLFERHGSSGRASATTPWGASVRACASRRARGTVSIGIRRREASSSISSSCGEGSWSSARRTRRTVRRPTARSSSTARRPSTWSPPSSPSAGADAVRPRPALAATTAGSGAGRAGAALPWAGGGHGLSSSTTAMHAMPSARPSAPEPFGAGGLDRHRCAEDPAQVLAHGVGVRSQTRRVRHDRAVRVRAGEALRGGEADDLGQQRQAVGALPLRVGVGEVAAEVAEADRAEHGVGQCVGHRVGVAVAGEPAGTLDRRRRRARADGAGRPRSDGRRCPVRRASSRLRSSAPPAGARRWPGRRGRDLEVAGVARHDRARGRPTSRRAWRRRSAARSRRRLRGRRATRRPGRPGVSAPRRARHDRACAVTVHRTHPRP